MLEPHNLSLCFLFVWYDLDFWNICCQFSLLAKEPRLNRKAVFASWYTVKFLDFSMICEILWQLDDICWRTVWSVRFYGNLMTSVGEQYDLWDFMAIRWHLMEKRQGVCKWLRNVMLHFPFCALQFNYYNLSQQMHTLLLML